MMRRLTMLLFGLTVTAAIGCPDDGAPSDVSDGDLAPELDTVPDTEPDTEPDADTGDTPGDTIVPHDGWLERLETPDDLAALADGGEVKYLARVAGRTPPAPLTAECFFQDMHRWQWHIEFLRSFPELADFPVPAYTSLVLARATRSLFGGSVRPWPAAVHPRTGLRGVVAYTVYSEPMVGSLTKEDLAELDATLERCIPFAADLLVFVPGDVAQKQLATSQRLALAELDVDLVMPENLQPGLVAEAYVEGEGYGTLLVVPEGELVQGYGPRDVVIASAAPNDIALVAGLLTKDPQNPHSHVNLRFAEKHIPNAAVTDIYQNALVASYAGKLVHLVVGASGVVLEPATLEAAEAFWEAHRPVVREPVADLSVTALEDFATLRAPAATAYGVKAANLGELYHLLPPEHRVAGFGIPFARYADFVAGAEGGALATRITAMLADPRMTTDAVFAAEQLELLREAIEDAPFPEALLAELADRIRAAFADGGDGADLMRIRFRSSTNAEDLDVISGAGLYDSKSGCLADDLDGDSAGPSRCLGDAERAFFEAEIASRQAELAAHPERVWLTAIIDDMSGDLTKEKPVARAVRKVWASLWNERAFEERAYYGIDHEKVFMGIAVDPSFVLESANAVAVTNLPAASGGPLYRVVSQTGWLSVVRPEDPLAVAEVLTFQRGAGDAPENVQVLVPSTLVPAGETVWSASELETMAGLLYLVQDHFASEVYPDLSPLALDLEIKRTADGRIVLKQVRPYLGGGTIGE